MNWTELLPYIRKGNQSNNLFIGRVTERDELGPYLVGMANACGGSIVVGMDLRNYHLFGTSIDQAWVDQLIFENCLPGFTCHMAQIERGGKYVALITVSEGTQKPHYYKRKCYSIDPVTNSLKMEQEIEIPVDVSPVEVLSVVPQKPWISSEIEIEQPIAQKITPLPESYPEAFMATVALKIQETSQEVFEEMKESTPQILKKSLKVEGLNRRQKKALTYLQKRQSIRNKKYRELYGVSHKTAHLELVGLLAKQIVVQQGAGRSTCYVLNQEQLSFA